MYTKEECNQSPDVTTISNWNGPDTPRLFLSGVPYHRIESDEIPPGYVCVPVKVDDNGVMHETMMVAGSIGVKLTSSGKPLAQRPKPYATHVTEDQAQPSTAQPDRAGLDTLQPVTGWFIFELKPEHERGGPDADSPYWAAEEEPEAALLPTQLPTLEVIEVGEVGSGH